MLLILVALAQLAVSLTTLDPRWLVSLDQPPAALPAFDADTAYVPLRNGQLAAVDLVRGRVLWQRHLPTAVSPSTGDGLLFVATGDGVEAVSGRTGRPQWQVPLPGRLVTVTWDTGWLLCSNDSGTLAALRASDGAIVWQATLDSPLTTAPAAGLDRVYVGLDGGRVMSLGLASGAETWTRTLTGRVTSLQAVDGQLIVGTSGNAVFSLDLTSGRQRWRWRVGGASSGPAASDSRHIYFVARDHVVRAVDRRNGNLRWTAELPSRPIGGPQLMDGVVMVPLATAMTAFDAITGKTIGTLPVSGEMSAPPYLHPTARATGARLITLTRDGRLLGHAPRIEEAPVPLETLPGQAVVP